MESARLTASAICPLCQWSAELTGDDIVDVRASIYRLIEAHIGECHPDGIAGHAYTVRASRVVLSHFIPYDSPGRRRRMALCGATVDATDHADPPSCPDCRRALDEREAMTP